MSLKQELTTWSNALDAYDAQDFDSSMQLFESIAESSKIHFNIGLVLATIGQHESAVQAFGQAIEADPYLAVAYYQSGVSNFLLERYEEARRDFDDAFQYMRSNATIDYEQLGLKFRLYSCEILFNRGLSSIYLDDESTGLSDLSLAMAEKQTPEHNVIDEAYADRGKSWRVFSIPVGVLYRPAAAKLKNLKTKNYLGEAKLIAATNDRDAFTGFSGTNKFLESSGGLREQGLVRSNTSGPRMEGKKDFLNLPKGTLSRRPSSPSAYSSATKMQDQQNSRPPFVSARTPPSAQLARNPSGRAYPLNQPQSGIPTPPASEGLRSLSPLNYTTRPVNNQEESPYDGAALIEDYYDEDGTALPPLPRLPRTDSIARPTPEGQPRERVANWARQNTAAGVPTSGSVLSRSNTGSTSVSSASRMGMGAGGNNNNMRGGMGLVRQMTAMNRSNEGMRMGGGRAGTEGSRYDDETTGYEGTIMDREMSKVRVKLRYNNDTRGMSISPEMALEDFVEKVRVKFNSPSDLPMKYRDAEGILVSIVDADDWESAIDEARESANGRSEGKLEIVL